MAAVRRRSGAGIVVALVFFVVLAFVGIGGCIWLYQKLELKKSALVETNSAIEQQIGQRFEAYQWPWDPKDEPTGLKYTTEVLAPVSGKLVQARLLETRWRDSVGYETADRVVEAYNDAVGGQEFNSLRDVIAFHNQQYPTLRNTRDQLRKRVNELEDLREKDRAEYTQKLEQQREEYNKEVSELRQDVKRFEETKNKLEEDLAQARQLREQLQSTLNERDRQFRSRLAEMRQTVQDLRDRIEELQRPPTRDEIPQLVALGEITAYKPDTGYRAFSGGKDQGILPNDRFVVYEITEKGDPRRKAVIQVSAVHDIISEFFVVNKKEDAELEEGDNVVLLQAWEDYQQATGGQ